MSFQNWNPDEYARHRRPIRIKRRSTRVGCISPAQLAFYGLVLLAIVIYAMRENSTAPDDKAVVVNTNGATSTRSTEGAYRYPSGTALNLGEVEWWIVKFTNAERASRGLKALIQDDDVATIAKAHSQNMTDRGLHHVIDGKNPTDRALAAGYDCRAYASPTSYTYGLSENISENPRVPSWQGTIKGSRTSWTPATFSKDARSMAEYIVKGWMNSPDHRKNILDADSRRIGVGVAVVKTAQGSWFSEVLYATQNFSKCE